MLNAFSDIPVNWVAGEDVARFAVEALLHPDKFGDQTAVYPGSMEQYTPKEVAAAISKFLGRSIEHRTISQSEWFERILELTRHDARISRDMAGHISAVAAHLKQPFQPNNLIAEITGQSPMTLAEALNSGQIKLA